MAGASVAALVRLLLQFLAAGSISRR